MCIVTHRFTSMRSDMGQGGDCCWAIATAVYSRTSDRSGMRRLWDSLGLAVGVNAKPMGARTLVEGSLIQLKFASSQLLDNLSNQYNHNLQNLNLNKI